MNTRRVVISLVLILVLLAGGIFGMKALLARKRPPLLQAREHLGPLVETVTATKADRRVKLIATGTFQAAATTAITAQVSGTVASLSPRLAAGAFFAAGEEMLAIEDIDYRIALEQARAATMKAQSALSQVEGNAAVARSEWQRISPGQEPPPLAVLEPQLTEAKAALAAARANEELAGLNLKRTRVTAPYPCRIVAKNVELGQYEKNGNVLVTVTATDRLEVVAPMELADLQWLSIPDAGLSRGSAATISSGMGDDGGSTWQGRILRMLGDVDPAGKMARLVIGVDHPYKGLAANRQPLLGMFVTVSLEGETLLGIIALPRYAVRENDTVWTVSSDSVIAIRPVHIVRYQGDEAWVDRGLDAGDRVVVTSLSGVAEGMKVRTRKGEEGR